MTFETVGVNVHDRRQDGFVRDHRGPGGWIRLTEARVVQKPEQTTHEERMTAFHPGERTAHAVWYRYRPAVSNSVC
jgi:hypothetical protein